LGFFFINRRMFTLDVKGEEIMNEKTVCSTDAMIIISLAVITAVLAVVGVSFG